MGVGRIEERLVAAYGGANNDGPELGHQGYLALLGDTLVLCFVTYSSPASGSGDMALVGLNRDGTVAWNKVIKNAVSGVPRVIGPRENGLIAWCAPTSGGVWTLHTAVVGPAGIGTPSAWAKSPTPVSHTSVALSHDGRVFALPGGSVVRVGALSVTGAVSAVKSANVALTPRAVTSQGVVFDSTAMALVKKDVTPRRTLTVGSWAYTGTSPTSDGGLLIYGQSYTGPVLLKIDANMAVSWEKRYFGDGTGYFQRVVESGGKLYAVGNYKSSYLVARLDTSGTMEWARRCSTINRSYGGAVLISWGLATILSGTGAGLNDALVCVMDPTGGLSGCQLFDVALVPSETDITESSLANGSAVTWTAETWGTYATQHSIVAQTLTRTPVCHEEVVVYDDGDPGDGGLPGDSDDASTKDQLFLVLDEDTGGWFPWSGLPGRDAHWNRELQRLELLGDGRMGVMPQRGRAYVYADLVVGFTGMGDRWRHKATLHAETDHRGDSSDVEVEFEVDGDLANVATKTLDPTPNYMGTDGHLELDAQVAFFSADKSGGVFSTPPQKTTRAYCTGKNRGRLSRFTLRHHTPAEFEISRLGLTFATRNLQ